MKYKKIFIIILIMIMTLCISACSNKIDDNNEDKPACDHIMNKVRTKAATCEESGYKAYYECELCGYKEDYEEIPAQGHVKMEMMGKKPTLTEDGYTDYEICKVCKKEFGKEVIKALDHIHYGAIIDYIKETKTQCLTYTKKCDKCGETYIEYGNALDREDRYMQELKVLMIGNSFTNYNTLIECMNRVIEEEGYVATVSKFSYGSQYLYDYLPGERGDYYEQLVKFMQGKKFDIVFLQEQSNNAAINPADFYDSVRDLYKYFSDMGSTVLLYETWSYGNGYNSVGWSYDEMHQRLSASYEAIAEELGLKVSRCGTAFSYLHNTHSDIPLYNSDNQHPSTYGTYIVSLVHYANIFGKSPIGINYKYNDYIKNEKVTWHSNNERVEISEETQRWLEEVAYKAAFGGSDVKVGYKTKSEGVTTK